MHTPLWRLFTTPIYFAADEGSGGGSGSSGSGGEGDNGKGGTPPPEAGSAGSNLPATQEELDKVIQDRLNRATRGTIKPEDLGFKSKAELDEAIKDLNTRREADKSEQDRLIDEARKEARTEAEAEILGKANARLVKSEFVSAAKDRNVVSPSDLYLIAQAEGRFTDLSVTDADEVDGMDDAWWEGLLKDRNHLVAQATQSSEQTPRTPGGNVNGASGAGSTGKVNKATDERRSELGKTYPALNRR